MKKFKTSIAVAVSVALLMVASLASATDDSRFVLELELGPAWQSRNTVQIPNPETGTRFSLQELVGSGPWAAGRLYFTWNINRRHGLRVMAAPLSYTESGIFDERVAFAGESYEPGVVLGAKPVEVYAIFGGQWPHWSFMIPGGVMGAPGHNAAQAVLADEAAGGWAGSGRQPMAGALVGPP